MTPLIDDIRSEVTRRGVKLNARISDEQLRALESVWGVELPSEYRAFITTIGNGGDGPPEYGLDPVGTNPSDDKYWKFPERYPKQLKKPFAKAEALLWEDEVPGDITDGLLYLGNDGCGMYWMLVVSGDARGEVWQLSEDGLQPCAPRLSFLEWYQSWLDGNTDWWHDYKG